MTTELDRIAAQQAVAALTEQECRSLLRRLLLASMEESPATRVLSVLGEWVEVDRA